MQTVISDLTALKPIQKLDALNELNWRLEVALSPVWNELRLPYEEVLSAINPFPEVLKGLPETALSPGSLNDPKPNWNDVRERWQNLALALVRFYREERQDELFELWHGRLSQLTVTSDAKARLCYERCLHGLARFDDETVTAALKAWPERTQDPYWAVRKAGLFAELGRLDEALRLAQSAVDTLRHGLIDTSDHIYALSREGWALRLLRGLNQAEQWRRHEFHSAAEGSLVERFRQLRQFGADPGELADWFTMRLEGPVPKPRPISETRLGFEPGTATRSTRSSDGFHDRIFPAYQYLRFAEETGIPPVIPHLDFSKDAHVAAAHWFAETDSPRTQSLMFRLFEEKILEQYLSRSRVAALPQSLADQWRGDALRAANAAIPESGTGERDTDPVPRRAARRLEAAAMIVARLTIRAPDAERPRLWEFARKLSTVPAVRGHVADPKALRALLRALESTASAEEMKAHLPALFDIPLPGEAGFFVFHPDNWPDPPLLVGHGQRGKVLGFTAEQFSATRRRAIAALKSESIHLRHAAMWRCDLLNDLGLLSSTEQQTLAKVFWAPVLKTSGLPWEAWEAFTDKLALSIPVPRGQSAAERMKDDILNKKLGEVRSGFVEPDSYFRRILYATAPRHAPRDNRRAYVEWTAADREALFAKLLGWWEDHGRKAVTQRRERRFFDDWDTNALSHFMRGLWNVVRVILLSQARRGSRFGKDILAFVEDVRTSGWPVGSVLPATLFVRPLGEVNVVASALRREFAHAGVEFYLSALRGLNHWAELSHPHRGRPTNFPAVPADLLREVGTAVAARRPGVVRLALQASVFMLKRLQQATDRRFRDSLLDGLDYLFTEATYSDKGSDTAGTKYEEIPSIRVEAVELAKCLADLGDGDQGVVRRWLESARTDPLPEVRRAVETTLDSPDD